MHELLFKINVWNVMVRLFEKDVGRMSWQFTEEELATYRRLLREYGYAKCLLKYSGLLGVKEFEYKES